ncbi:hypothetical protein ACFXTN_017091 [Malus domestica]
MSVSSLARMAQASDESPMDYLTRFKSARNWCRVRMEETSPVRRRLDFDASFYDDDYYKRNSSSSGSSRSQKTFKPPEPRDQRWYTYHSSKGVYTALSKSQKRGINGWIAWLADKQPRNFGP